MKTGHDGRFVLDMLSLRCLCRSSASVRFKNLKAEELSIENIDLEVISTQTVG